MDTEPKGKRMRTLDMRIAPRGSYYSPGSTSTQPTDESALATDKILMSVVTTTTPAAV